MVCLLPNRAESQTFIDALYRPYVGKGYVEFRLIKDKAVKREFADPEILMPGQSETFWNRLAQANQDGYNVYFGVATRDYTHMKPEFVPALWVDIDFKDMPPSLLGPAIESKLDLLTAYIPPSIIVWSGHGIHAYWLTSAGPDDHAQVKTLNKKLAIMFNGDNVSDMARVLRVPGYFNVKNMEKPVLCKVSSPTIEGILNSGPRYDLFELGVWLESVELPYMSGDLMTLVQRGNTGEYASRSEADFACVAGLIEAGYGEDEIIELYDSPENLIGEKYREKGIHGPNYLANTIRAARTALTGGK